MSKEENKIINYLKELSKYELFLDNIFIKDKTARQILVSAYNKLKRQQKEIEGKNAVIDTYKHSEKVLTEQIDEQEKEIEELTLDLEEMTKSNNHKKENWVHKNILNSYISKDKIREKIKELEEQKEKLKYDGNRSFAEYEQFCKNLKFFKEQVEELLEEN